MFIDMQNHPITTDSPTILGMTYTQGIDMKVKDLHLIECNVDANLTVREITEYFKFHPEWPGVIIVSNDHFFGMLSRHHCFEILGKPFGLEIFSRSTILDFYKFLENYCQVIDAETSIQEAVKIALAREKSQIFEPIVVCLSGGDFRILNMHVLLLAQCDVLENLYDEYHQLSIIDPLTKTYNRRGFFKFAQHEIYQTHMKQNDLSALMIDIDNFKETNDLYGHFIGDMVLEVVALEIQETLRQTDLIGRFGGEEFIALLPNTTIELAYSIAERLRKTVEDRIVEIYESQISVTISIGVSHINCANGNLDVLLSQADQAMYRAKASGRNRVLIWNRELICSTTGIDTQKNLETKTYKNKNGEYISRLEKIYDETIEGWSKAIEVRDREMQGHAQRVADLTIALARQCGIKETELQNIRRGALLHDIGKIAIPDYILFKPGKLSEDEWIIMRKHPVYAYDFLSPISFLQKCIDIPYCHHEHWDGSGYPRGLKGQEIPISARIFTIIDVWDALCTDRCYRPAWSQNEVRDYIVSQSGRIFDPAITKHFIKLIDEKRLLSESLLVKT